MNLEALALLETPTVRKLVATWPKVQIYDQDTMAVCRRWSEISAVHYKLAYKWLQPLLANDIIKLDGTIHDAAATYIAQCAVSRAKFSSESRKKQLDS